MFHRYVTHNGHQIDYDRASWLMDKETFDEAVRSVPNYTEFDEAVAARNGWALPPKLSASERLQAVWNAYCNLHARKYGEPFNPDVM